MPLQPLPLDAVPALADAEASIADSRSKQQLEEEMEQLGKRLDRLQIALFAERRRALLVVLQGRDGSGKDGVIRHVFGKFNPQGLDIHGFRAPTSAELAHDYLWRVHAVAPPRGLVGVFNRSHYEDVLVPRVHQLLPQAVWERRYGEINDFERTLHENGTTILKFFLHISREEQRKRMLERLDDPEKQWKFNAADLNERECWDEYSRAYQDLLSRCSTAWGPWYIVPSDRKPLRDVLIAETVLAALETMRPAFPPADPEVLRLREKLG